MEVVLTIERHANLLGYAFVACLAAACVEQGAGAELLLPDAVSVAWEPGYDAEGDGLAALVAVDLMAYDGATGEPLAAIPLEVWAENGAVWPVEHGEVVVVDPADCFGCELFWDEQRDEFLLVPELADSLSVRTDRDGLARVYLYVDAFPEAGSRAGSSADRPSERGAEGQFGEVVVVVVMGDDAQSFLLLPR